MANKKLLTLLQFLLILAQTHEGVVAALISVASQQSTNASGFAIINKTHVSRMSFYIVIQLKILNPSKTQSCLDFLFGGKHELLS